MAVTFHTPEGGTYTATEPGEINRLLLSRSHFVTPEAAAEPLSDNRFHPESHNVPDVLAYLEEHPEDHDRVLGEERAGKARQGILGE